MGLTLEELKLILTALTFDDDEECGKAIKLVAREIKLKTMNPVTGRDAQGNSMDGGE